MVGEIPGIVDPAGDVAGAGLAEIAEQRRRRLGRLRQDFGVGRTGTDGATEWPLAPESLQVREREQGFSPMRDSRTSAIPPVSS
jgi:hypothetical protein